MSPNPYSLDDADPFGYARRRMKALSPSVPPAALNSSGASQGFSPDDPGDDSPWYGPKLDPAANRVSNYPSLTASGPSGNGQTAQPQAKLADGDLSVGAGNVLGGGKKWPPPGTSAPSASDDPGAAGAAPEQPQAQLPPGVTPQMKAIQDRQQQLVDAPPKMIGSRPQDFDQTTGKEKIGAKAASWGQRLAMAILSAGKLAPYAQQIVHPDYTQQVEANAAEQKGLQGELENQEKIENIGYLGESREAIAAQKKAQADNYVAENQRKAEADQASEQIKRDDAFTKTLPKDGVVTGLDPNDPNIPALQAQGWHVTDDLRDHREGVPKMKVAVPPQFVTVTPQNANMLPGKQLNERVPYSEYKSGLAEFQKQQLEIQKNANKPPSAEGEKLAYQGIIQKLAAAHGVSPGALTDVRQLLPAIQSSQALTPEEKNHAVAYLTANPTPPATGTNTTVKIEGANSAAGDKADSATRAAAFKAYAPTLDSAERFNVMAKNYEDAVKNNDQQAMLSLLANHLGMTMGLQKGARLSKDIIQEAQHSRPWLQGMAAKFDNNGYLSGVTLSPDQMRQMVSLGRERFSEDLSKSRSESRYMGATDDGPDRTPNRATINFYTAMAGGNPTKAKQLAQTDGWSIK